VSLLEIPKDLAGGLIGGDGAEERPRLPVLEAVGGLIMPASDTAVSEAGAPGPRLTSAERNILQALRTGPLTGQKIAEVVGIKHDYARTLLRPGALLRRDGLVRPAGTKGYELTPAGRAEADAPV
jgi:hypothetical protein